MQVLANAAGELLDVFAVDIHQVKIPIPGPGRCKSNLAPIGAETRLHIVGRIVGELDHTRSVDALKINIRALAVSSAGEGNPLAAWIEHDVGVMPFIRRSMLLKRKIGPRLARTIDGWAHFSIDVHDWKKRRIGDLRPTPAI